LWFAGRQERQAREAKRQAYINEILKKEAILVDLSKKELAQNNSGIVIDELASKPIIATSTTSTSSQQALRRYGLDLAVALKPLSQRRDSETKAVLSAIDSKDPSLLKPVTSSRIIHEQVASNLKKVVVPKEIASRHFKIASQINLLISRLKNMEQALSQPTAALEASQTFNADYLAFIKSIEVLNQFFALNKVQFSDQEKMQIFVSN
jgi:hypothetical protein